MNKFRNWKFSLCIIPLFYNLKIITFLLNDEAIPATGC
jgi:hypothetical protein